MLSLVTIIAIYREGGILKRLRATPLRPHTILMAHVLVKLLLHRDHAGADAAGRPALTTRSARQVPIASFAAGAAVHAPAASCRSGFLMASLVPTARFAQPVGAARLLPDDRAVGTVRAGRARCRRRCRRVARVLPLTYAVSLLQGIWQRRTVVGPPRRRRRPGDRRNHRRRAVGPVFPVGVNMGARCGCAVRGARCELPEA